METHRDRETAHAWIIAVDMGYGHQRTAYPLRHLAPNGKVINANHYDGELKADIKVWESSRKFYEFMSNFKRVPLIGPFAFQILDKFQEILRFYPKRDLSRPNISLRKISRLIKNNWGRHLINILKKEDLPIVSTFFIPAFMAEQFHYPNEIFTVICDADIARPWAPLNPFQSRIKYFAPNKRTIERLMLYGVKKENIFLTGYPLPKENIGTEKMEILKMDLSHRLLNLDPKRTYQKQYGPLIEKYIGRLPAITNHPLTIMFSVGGAGAQKEMVPKIVKSCRGYLKSGLLKIILSAGVKESVKEYLIKSIADLGLGEILNKNIEIIYEKNIQDYFARFNEALRKTDILWTKPSELSFYTGLGLPIIMAPTIGSQEDFNKEWLLRLGSGTTQENPRYTHQWLFDLLESGWFAEAAMQGFIEAEKMGTYNMERIIDQCYKQ